MTLGRHFNITIMSWIDVGPGSGSSFLSFPSAGTGTHVRKWYGGGTGVQVQCFHKAKWATIDPPAKRHLNGVSYAGQWWPDTEYWPSSFVIVQDVHDSSHNRTFSFVIFRGRGTPFLPLS